MKVILVDEKISFECERALMKMGLQPIKLPPDKRLGVAVRSHPDTLIFYHDKQIITTAEYCDDAAYIFSDIRELCPMVRIIFTSDTRGDKYPNDCNTNALVIENNIFCNTTHISDAIKNYAMERGLSIIHTNQGYPACTVLAFGDRAITSDLGMAKILRENGVEVLIINQGHISLPPHEYGFIGGSSFLYNNKVCFFGNLNSHPDGEKIRDFIAGAGFEAVSLSDGGLVDLGGGIVL